MSTIEGRRVLVTGASGFTGKYVCDALIKAGHSVATPPRPLDLSDHTELREIIEDTPFDDVIHLAAISFVGHADASDFYRINTVGTTALLESVLGSGRPVGRVVLASSANIYGNNPSSPIVEIEPPAPVNHYAASKAAMEMMVQQWITRLPIVIARPFNYTGRGQRAEFLIPKIVRHFVEKKSTIELGNINVIRDFSDVRDVADIYVKLLSAPEGATVNICSGVGATLRSIIDYCSRFSGHEINIQVNPAFVRADEIRELIGSDVRLNQVIGSEDRRSLGQTLDWMLGSGSA